MKSVICLFIFSIYLSVLNAQISNQEQNLLGQVSQKEAIKSLLLLKNLNEKSITISGDSLITSADFENVINNKEYQKEIYPDTYTWKKTIYFINTKELKKAFWYLINLYPMSEQNKEIVLKTILAYNQLIKMDEVLINTFYSYCFMDPTISIIKNGKPEIMRPDILEKKLNDVREIVTYLQFYRSQKAKENID